MQLNKKGIELGSGLLEWKNMEGMDVVVMHTDHEKANRFLKVKMVDNEEPVYVPLSEDIKTQDDFVQMLQQYIKDNPGDGNVKPFNTHHTASF